MQGMSNAPRESSGLSRVRVGRSVNERVASKDEADIEHGSPRWQARRTAATEVRIAHPTLTSRIRSVLRLVVMTVRWIAVAIALVVWLVVVPLVDLLRGLLTWLARRVRALRRRLPW